MNTTIHRCPGLSSTGLMTYLAALGLAKVVGEQADPEVRFGWTEDHFYLRTTIPDLSEFLLRDYRPTPVVSPWNGGSGFGAKDKSQKEFIERLAASSSDRLSDYRATISAVGELLGNGDESRVGWDKTRLVQELRNRVPDAALSWLDASVVLATDKTVKAVFPPLLGTGGNDGRLDYSSTFHQRLADVLPELGASPSTSLGWAMDLINGTATTPLKDAAVGQFDPFGAGGPGTSSFGSGSARVNPWAFVLMIEGTMWFAAAAARRLGEVAGRAAMPFTVFSSPDGPLPGAPDEPSRGELWAPVLAATSLRQLRQIMTEARASWNGATALSGLDMYGAVHTFGVDRGIERFQRFAFVQRNGLAYIAAHVDTVDVVCRPEVALAIEPMRRAQTFARASGAGAQRHTRAFDTACLTFMRDPAPQHMIDLLTAETRLEISAMRGQGNRANLYRPARLAAAGPILALLAPLLARSAELRVAAGLASGYLPGSNGHRLPIRLLVMGGDPGGREPAQHAVVAGLGVRPLIDVLSDLVVWRSQHPVEDSRVSRGMLPMRGHHVVTHWRDVHSWANGLLNDQLIERAFLGLLALDWREVATRREATPQVSALDPDFAVLQALASGHVLVPGVSADAADGRQGIQFDWPLRLCAGQVDSVSAEAAVLLSRSRVRVPSTSGHITQTRARYRVPPRSGSVSGRPGPANDPTRGRRMLAALVAPASLGALRSITVARSDDRELSDVQPGEGVPE